MRDLWGGAWGGARPGQEAKLLPYELKYRSNERRERGG